jgi:hypothetical protein
MSITVLFVFVVGMSLLLYSFRMFDRIVRAEYEVNRAAWEADGKPRGFFWSAPECTFFRSDWARNRLSFVWLFKTPAWAVDSVDCQTWLTRFRACVLAWNFLAVFDFFVLAGK